MDASQFDTDRLAQICRRYGIATLAVFGSVARGEDSAQSDIDLLYELQSDARLGWEIENLSDELTCLFGRPVDLVARRALHLELREAVIAECRVLLSGVRPPTTRRRSPPGTSRPASPAAASR
ncbi:nucleotidyltransferase family protein [Pseudonocardia phyllosphaerae]|uniref:nucleotidyltransferase family protein n=1 Tax=Pseudonocardia phyllosphaerae TaxID=3390502 RepID=UPI00397CA420